VRALTPLEAIVVDNSLVKGGQCARAYDAISAKADAGLKLFDREFGLLSENTVRAAVREGSDEFGSEVRKQVL
jgi:hypothetical protein